MLVPLYCFVFLTFHARNAVAQDSVLVKPPHISSKKIYERSIKDDVGKKMVELRSIIPDIVYDLRYATTNNFIGKEMYPPSTKHTFLRRTAAEALEKVQDELALKGYGLKIFDAYRPYAVTIKFWDLIKDERYVANPSKGSGHNRGIAVDLTIIEIATGKELEMGTGFDNFTDTAHHTFTSLAPEIIENRKLLRSLMEKNGFKALSTEWWHYSWPDPAKFEILDLSFSQLKRAL